MSRPSAADSPVVTTTVRLLAPFVLTFALFTLFHGTSSVGGGFQGGVVAAAVVVTLAFAFGVEATAAWLDRRVLAGLVAAGPVVFGVVALAGLAFGGAFLQFDVLPVPKATVYATEAIELGIGATVAAVVVVLFVGLASDEGTADDRPDEPAAPDRPGAGRERSPGRDAPEGGDD